jgi:hypothetical protein
MDIRTDLAHILSYASCLVQSCPVSSYSPPLPVSATSLRAPKPSIKTHLLLFLSSNSAPPLPKGLHVNGARPQLGIKRGPASTTPLPGTFNSRPKVPITHDPQGPLQPSLTSYSSICWNMVSVTQRLDLIRHPRDADSPSQRPLNLRILPPYHTKMLHACDLIKSSSTPISRHVLACSIVGSSLEIALPKHQPPSTKRPLISSNHQPNHLFNGHSFQLPISEENPHGTSSPKLISHHFSCHSAVELLSATTRLGLLAFKNIHNHLPSRVSPTPSPVFITSARFDNQKVGGNVNGGRGLVVGSEGRKPRIASQPALQSYTIHSLHGAMFRVSQVCAVSTGSVCASQ